MMRCAYYLPEHTLSNSDLAGKYSDWTEERIYAKTGISLRHVAGDGIGVLELAENACKRLFAEGVDSRNVDFLILCTQSSKYRLPSTACILQDRLGIPTTAGAFDYNLGCSGFVYGLAMAKGLMVAGIARTVLLVTAETYTKYIGAEDRATRTIFGDGAAATFLDKDDVGRIGEFVLGTDGRGADLLMLRDGENLHMDGPEIFNFTLDIVPSILDNVCAKNDMSREDIDLFVFHQANRFMLDTIRKLNMIPKDKFYVNLDDTGNTVSSTIPIALKRAEADGVLKRGMRVLLMGFGVGLSWGGTVITY